MKGAVKKKEINSRLSKSRLQLHPGQQIQGRRRVEVPRRCHRLPRHSCFWMLGSWPARPTEAAKGAAIGTMSLALTRIAFGRIPWRSTPQRLVPCSERGTGWTVDGWIMLVIYAHDQDIGGKLYLVLAV